MPKYKKGTPKGTAIWGVRWLVSQITHLPREPSLLFLGYPCTKGNQRKLPFGRGCVSFWVPKGAEYVRKVASQPDYHKWVITRLTNLFSFWVPFFGVPLYTRQPKKNHHCPFLGYPFAKGNQRNTEAISVGVGSLFWGTCVTYAGWLSDCLSFGFQPQGE